MTAEREKILFLLLTDLWVFLSTWSDSTSPQRDEVEFGLENMRFKLGQHNKKNAIVYRISISNSYDAIVLEIIQNCSAAFKLKPSPK